MLIVTRGVGGVCSRSLLIANKDDCKRRFFSGDDAFSRHVFFLWRGGGEPEQSSGENRSRFEAVAGCSKKNTWLEGLKPGIIDIQTTE